MYNTQEKLKILAEGAKYDVSCSSSGSGRRGTEGMGSTSYAGICHTWAADGRCVSLLKVLFSNKCVYNCKYCISNRSSDFPRVSFEPRELADLTMGFYRRNYIEGLFISSAVDISPDYTSERMLECLRILRDEYGFGGYIHTKVIPGTSAELVHVIGMYSDRLSVNLELPSEASLKRLAPQKKKQHIFSPMRQITNSLIESRSLKGPGNMFAGTDVNDAGNYLSGKAQSGADPSGPESFDKRTDEKRTDEKRIDEKRKDRCVSKKHTNGPGSGMTASGMTASELRYAGYRVSERNSSTKRIGSEAESGSCRSLARRSKQHKFAPAGQTTQMMIGASEETDLQIMKTTQDLYRTFKMKRVYFSAYIPLLESPVLPALGTLPPLKREHRLYQADWLLRFYHFDVSELLDESNPDLDPDLDPKVNWALRHLDQFPIEINKASYEELLRIPGIGNKSALRIIKTRRNGNIRFEDLKKMGVVIKRAKYFLTCRGRYCGDSVLEPDILRTKIIGIDNGIQLSMFDSAGSMGRLNAPNHWSASGALPK